MQNKVKASGCVVNTIYPEYFPLNTLNKNFDCKSLYLRRSLPEVPNQPRYTCLSCCWHVLSALLWWEWVGAAGSSLVAAEDLEEGQLFFWKAVYGKGEYSDFNPLHNKLAVGSEERWTVLSCYPHNKQKQVTARIQWNKMNLRVAWQTGLSDLRTISLLQR